MVINMINITEKTMPAPRHMICKDEVQFTLN